MCGIALRVVGSLAAAHFFVVVMLALYPIFNSRVSHQNPDLRQLVTCRLVVAGLSHAFEKRTWRSADWMGLAGAHGDETQIIGCDHDRPPLGLAGADPSGPAEFLRSRRHGSRIRKPSWSRDPASDLAADVDFVQLDHIAGVQTHTL